MRRIAAAAACLLVGAVLGVPVASAAAPLQPKVAIIVGPVASSTAFYKADGDAAYAEALKYTSNVVRVYTPNATWAAAKKAMQNASIVIYMGHGNGFPSPYRSSPWPYSQNGLGLNPTSGGDNTTTKYYGEQYLANEVDLAPNAIVLLNHLCYASGNSESGKPRATLSQARQRVDNMAAGWLKTGARAVVAEAHAGPAWYVRQLFTTHKTVDQIFHDAPTFNDNAFSFPSSRTKGATAEMDPDGTAGGYWRSVTGWLGTTTDAITGATYADTGTDPAAFEVPGAASVGVDTAAVHADETLSPDAVSATLPRDTRLRLLATSHLTTTAGDPIFEIATLDATTTGWMSGADLVPRDSASPVVWATDDGDGAFSPNGDGSGDSYLLTGRVSETVDWTVRFEDGDGSVIATRTGSGDTFSATWNGIVAGSTVPDGTYRWQVTAHDRWGNPDGAKSGTFLVDTDPPAFDDPVVAAAGGIGPPTFSPNGDGRAETIAFGFSIDESGYVDVTIRNSSGAVARSFATPVATGSGSVSWDGRDDAGHVVGDGQYSVGLAPRDLAGNVGPGRTRSVAVYTALSHVASSKAVFYPQDLDRLGRTTRFSFSLSAPATVSGVVRNEAGDTIRTMFAAVPMSAGTHVFDWDGRRTDGTMAPRGTYTAEVEATNGVLSIAGITAVVADGFRITLSDMTPGRGQVITLYATSPELLKTLPRVRVSQSGTSAFSLAMKRTGTYTYRLTLKLKSTSGPGTVRFSLSATDRSGGTNRASRTFALH